MIAENREYHAELYSVMPPPFESLRVTGYGAGRHLVGRFSAPQCGIILRAKAGALKLPRGDRLTLPPERGRDGRMESRRFAGKLRPDRVTIDCQDPGSTRQG